MLHARLLQCKCEGDCKWEGAGPATKGGVSVSTVERFLGSGRMRKARGAWKGSWGRRLCCTPGVSIHALPMSLRSRYYSNQHSACYRERVGGERARCSTCNSGHAHP